MHMRVFFIWTHKRWSLLWTSCDSITLLLRAASSNNRCLRWMWAYVREQVCVWVVVLLLAAGFEVSGSLRALVCLIAFLSHWSAGGSGGGHFVAAAAVKRWTAGAPICYTVTVHQSHAPRQPCRLATFTQREKEHLSTKPLSVCKLSTSHIKGSLVFPRCHCCKESSVFVSKHPCFIFF